jgi:hypothetical protein
VFGNAPAARARNLCNESVSVAALENARGFGTHTLRIGDAVQVRGVSLLKSSSGFGIVEVARLWLLAFCRRARPYNNAVQIPSHRTPQPSCDTGGDHRIAPSIDRVPTNSKAKADHAQWHRPLPMGLAIAIVVGSIAEHLAAE